MNPVDIAPQRLRNQHINKDLFERPQDVVRWLTAIQAQDYAGAKWALGLRMRGATDDDIEQSFNKGEILRTHLLRPTWHFVTPADIRWLLGLTAPRVHAVNASMVRQLELDHSILTRSGAVIAKTLRGGRQLTRDELRSVLVGVGIPSVDGLRMSYILMHAELEGIVCSGARNGRQFTYALLDERAPDGRTLERDEALAELARRYIQSHGPATVQDFANWSGLAAADARQGFEAVKSQFEQARLDDRSYWFSSSTPPEEDASPRAYLLSVYDEYFIGYKDRRTILDAGIAARLSELGNALQYIILLDGQIVGTWKRMLRKDSVRIEINILTRLTEAEQHAIFAAAQRYGEFLGLPVSLAGG